MSAGAQRDVRAVVLMSAHERWQRFVQNVLRIAQARRVRHETYLVRWGGKEYLLPVTWSWASNVELIGLPMATSTTAARPSFGAQF